MAIENEKPRKHAMITGEQESLIRAFEQAKGMEYGEFTIYLQAGKITRWEVKKSSVNSGELTNKEALDKAKGDLEGLDVIAI